MTTELDVYLLQEEEEDCREDAGRGIGGRSVATESGSGRQKDGSTSRKNHMRGLGIGRGMQRLEENMGGNEECRCEEGGGVS